MTGVIDFALKGDRAYVQGPDILDGAVAWLRAHRPGAGLANLDLVVHRLLRSAGDCELLARGAYVRGPADCAVLGVDVDGDGQVLVVRESGRELTRRRPYDEEEILRHSAFDLPGARVSLARLSGFSLAEAVTAMNKALLTRLFPERRGKWLFTRMQLAAPAEGPALAGIEVALRANLQFKLTRSALRHRDADVGQLYFTLT